MFSIKKTFLFLSLLSTTNCSQDQQDSSPMDIVAQKILSGVSVSLGESRNLMQIAAFENEGSWSVPADHNSGSLSWYGHNSNGIRPNGANLKKLDYSVANLSHTWAHKSALKDSFSIGGELLLFKGNNIPTRNVKFNAKLNFELRPNYRPTTSHIVGTFPSGWLSITCDYLNINDKNRSSAIARESKPINQVSANWIAESVSLVSEVLDFKDCLSRKAPSISFNFGVSGAYGIKIKEVELQMLNVD